MEENEINDIKTMLIELGDIAYYNRRRHEEFEDFKKEYNDLIEAEQLKAQVYDGIRVQSSQISDKVSQVAEKYKVLLDKFAEHWEEKDSKYRKLDEAINNLPEELYWIIKDRYIYKKSYRKIARFRYQDASTVYRKEQAAIKLILNNMKLATNATNKGL